MAELDPRFVEAKMEEHVFEYEIAERTDWHGNVQPAYTVEEQGWDAWHDNGSNPELVEELGTVRIIHEHGGEGEGTMYYVVFEVTDLEGKIHHFRKDGSWVSHDGLYWDGDFDSTVQAERLITVWE